MFAPRAINKQMFRTAALAAALVVFTATAGWANVPAGSEYASDPFSPAIARESWDLIGRTEQQYGVPAGLLHAMSLVETGQGMRGWMLPWPYTVCINGTGTKNYLKLEHAVKDLAWMRSLGFVRFDVKAGGQSLSNARVAEATALLAAQPNATAYSITPRPFSRRFSNAEEATQFVYGMFAKGYRNMDLGLMQINWRVHGNKLGSVQAAFDPQRNVRYAVTYLLEHKQTRDWWGSVGRYHSGTPQHARRYVGKVYGWYKRVHDFNAAHSRLAGL